MVTLDIRETAALSAVTEFERHIFENFTPRQLEIATLLCAGTARTKELCERLHITARTLEAHLHKIYEKAAITSSGQGKRAQLIADIFLRFDTRAMGAHAEPKKGSNW